MASKTIAKAKGRTNTLSYHYRIETSRTWEYPRVCMADRVAACYSAGFIRSGSQLCR